MKKVRELNRGVYFLLLLLDISVLYSIFYGISFQREVLSNPEVEYSYSCRSFLGDDINSSIYYYDENFKSGNYGEILSGELDSRCNSILNSADRVSSNKELQKLKSLIEKDRADKSGLEMKLIELKNLYRTTLLEKIAESERALTVEKIQMEMGELQNSIDLLGDEVAKNLNIYYKSQPILELKGLVESYGESILSDYRSDSEYFELKLHLIEFIFITPLTLLFYYLRNREEYLQKTVFKHLFYVTLIPLFISLYTLLVELLPRIFIEAVIEFFYNLQIPFVLYYILIAIGVITIYPLLKFINSRDRDGSDSFRKNRCPDCLKPVNYNSMRYCPHCSNELKVECKNCGELKISGLSYCHNCGK